MTRVFLVRHAEPSAAWGDAPDPGLSKRGRAQAKAAAKALPQGLAVVSSPMLRCRETAAPYLAGGEALLEARVSEVATPVDVADRRSWLQHHFPWRAGAVRRPWSELGPPLWAWRRKTLEALSELKDDTVVFTHFIAINAIVGQALEREETIVCRPDFASITELELREGVVRLVALGAEMSEGEVR